METAAFNHPFVWLKRTVTVDPGTGENKETFTTNGTLWGSCFELTAMKRLAFGALNSQASLELRFRQWPALNANDRLADPKFNTTIVVDGVVPNWTKNELQVYAHVLTEG